MKEKNIPFVVVIAICQIVHISYKIVSLKDLKYSWYSWYRDQVAQFPDKTMGELVVQGSDDQASWTVIEHSWRTHEKYRILGDICTYMHIFILLSSRTIESKEIISVQGK